MKTKRTSTLARSHTHISLFGWLSQFSVLFQIFKFGPSLGKQQTRIFERCEVVQNDQMTIIFQKVFHSLAVYRKHTIRLLYCNQRREEKKKQQTPVNFGHGCML